MPVLDAIHQRLGEDSSSRGIQGGAGLIECHQHEMTVPRRPDFKPQFIQRFILTLLERSSIMVSMVNRLSTERRVPIIGCLTEGNSIRATARMTGAAKNTITKLLIDLGEACAGYQDRVLRDLPCTTLQVDEI